MHLKRQNVPKNWPIHRKGTKYVVRSSNLREGIPLLILLRDMLKIVQNRKELKKAIHNKYILVNSREVRDEKMSISLFDKITIVPSKKYYKLNLSSSGKYLLEEIKENEANHKIIKIINKKILKRKKKQLNFIDGRNCLSDIECKVNDSIIFDFKQNKIIKCLPLKEKAKVIVFAGKHSGKEGIINKINKERKMVELESNKEKINVLIKQITIIE